jgi:PHD/YefM family antitoxin component YafN of YafNO toxin-antitoxin module
MEDVYTPTKARKNLFQIIEDVNDNHTPVRVISVKDGKKGVRIIADDDYNAMMETLALEANGVMDVVRSREGEEEEDAFDALEEVRRSVQGQN